MELDTPAGRRPQEGRRRGDSPPHVAYEVEEVAGMRVVESVAGVREQECERVRHADPVAVAQHEQALERMEGGGEDDRVAAHAPPRPGEGAGAVEVEGPEIAVPRAFDESVVARRDADAVAHEHRRAGARAGAPRERRQVGERLELELQDSRSSNDGDVAASADGNATARPRFNPAARLSSLPPRWSGRPRPWPRRTRAAAACRPCTPARGRARRRRARRRVS